jgi:hypothetical protein
MTPVDKCKVPVYFNLHRKCYSVVAAQGPNKGRVIAHVHTLLLKDVSFTVRKAGRERVLREGKKNVHAFINGTLCELSEVATMPNDTCMVTYNPFKAGHFYPNDMGPRYAATMAKGAAMTVRDGKPLVNTAGLACC